MTLIPNSKSETFCCNLIFNRLKIGGKFLHLQLILMAGYVAISTYLFGVENNLTFSRWYHLLMWSFKIIQYNWSLCFLCPSPSSPFPILSLPILLYISPSPIPFQYLCFLFPYFPSSHLTPPSFLHLYLYLSHISVSHPFPYSPSSHLTDHHLSFLSLTLVFFPYFPSSDFPCHFTIFPSPISFPYLFPSLSTIYPSPIPFPYLCFLFPYFPSLHLTPSYLLPQYHTHICLSLTFVLFPYFPSFHLTPPSLLSLCHSHISVCPSPLSSLHISPLPHLIQPSLLPLYHSHISFHPSLPSLLPYTIPMSLFSLPLFPSSCSLFPLFPLHCAISPPPIPFPYFCFLCPLLLSFFPISPLPIKLHHLSFFVFFFFFSI